MAAPALLVGPGNWVGRYLQASLFVCMCRPLNGNQPGQFSGLVSKAGAAAMAASSYHALGQSVAYGPMVPVLCLHA